MASLLGALKSKTIWLNLIAIAASYVLAHSGSVLGALPADVQAFILAGLNIIVRFMTKEPLSAKVSV